MVHGNDDSTDDHTTRSSKRIKTSLFGIISEESRPLGLSLDKSPSLLNLIQRKVFDGSEDLDITNGATKEREKMKASNFPALSVKIGSWEKISFNEGHVVTKFYFAKHKLVWEVLDCKMKRKIEIQWSDVSAIRATFQEKQCSVLQVEVKRPPLFFQEKDPQPKKHTLWHPTSDFTGGHASTYRIHRLEFAEGMLKKHYQKLMAHDKQLRIISQQKPFPSSNSPFFPLLHPDSFKNLYGLDYLVTSRQLSHPPYNRSLPTSYHGATGSSSLHTSARNSNQIANFHPHTLQANALTSTDNLNLRLHPQGGGHLPSAGQAQDFLGASRASLLNISTGLRIHARPPTQTNLVHATFQKPDENGMQSNHLWLNSCRGRIHDKIPSSDDDPSSTWELKDIIDHLFGDHPSPVGLDNESLMKKIRSIDAHLNELPGTTCSIEIPRGENDGSGTCEDY